MITKILPKLISSIFVILKLSLCDSLPTNYYVSIYPLISYALEIWGCKDKIVKYIY